MKTKRTAFTIFKVPESRNTIAIMIAHRLSTIRNMDRIYVLDDGRIAEGGTHEELMRHNGIYFEMFTKQAEKYQK